MSKIASNNFRVKASRASFLVKTALVATALTIGIGLTTRASDPLSYARFYRDDSASIEERGLFLYHEIGCAQCHPKVTGLPPRLGPNLVGILDRVNPEWLVDFLKGQPQASMVSQPCSQTGQAVAILAYLQTIQKQPSKNTRVPRHVNRERGDQLFFEIGCAACHSGPNEQPEADSIDRQSIAPLDQLSKKYDLLSLTSFLKQPNKTHPSGRMPHFDLSDFDATDLAGFLLQHQGSNGATAETIRSVNYPLDLAETGHAAIEKGQCYRCHLDLKEAFLSTHDKWPLANPNQGCLSGESSNNRPTYHLPKTIKAAIVAYLESPLTRPLALSQQRNLNIAIHNCLHCHRRGGQGGPLPSREAYFKGDPDMGDAGRMPPPLTAIEEKLQSQWLHQVLNGQAPTIRHYLKTRMPHFQDFSTYFPIPRQSEKEDQSKAVPVNPELAELTSAGSKLVGPSGLNCVTCHRWDQRPSLGIDGMDLIHAKLRLRKEWLKPFLENPSKFLPNTLMPSFWPDGIAAHQAILKGDSERQIEAIIAFLRESQKPPQDYPLNQPNTYELTPKNKPIIQRTFMEGVGTRAILVGFPQGIHMAYDAQKCGPALSWQGRFFDAYDTWFTRRMPFQRPLESNTHSWPLPDESNRLFRGYSLSSEGIPTFLHDRGKTRVKETFFIRSGTLHRRLEWTPLSAPVPVIVHPTSLKVSVVQQSPGVTEWAYSRHD